MEIRDLVLFPFPDPIETQKVYHIICSCPLCAVDFTINIPEQTSTEDSTVSTKEQYIELLGTPDLYVFCPLCKTIAVVDDKEEEYM